jgi:leucyl-tRNA synthetase
MFVGTVLANEEVINGLSERGSHPVFRRPLRQWMLRITKFADQLEAGLSELNWPEGTLASQKQWIGRSNGALVKFPIPALSDEHIEVFTTRPDTLMGVSYIVLAPEHPLVNRLVSINQKVQVDEYVFQASLKSDMERSQLAANKDKSGVFLGCSVLHPITGKPVPVWISDYVLGSYGTGAVMAVPAHDDRDYDFAEKYNLPIIKVIDAKSPTECQRAYSGEGLICNSGEFDGLSSIECAKKITTKLHSLGLGSNKIMFKLHDWIFSRQRYWGEPIPIYFPVEFNGSQTTDPDPRDPQCLHRICYESPIGVDESELPLALPDLEDFSPSNDPQGCLAKAVDWRYFKRDGRWYARETSTMPQVFN